MKLVDADLLQDVIYEFREKFRQEDEESFVKYFKREFEIYDAVVKTVKASTAPELRIIQAKYYGWIRCDKELPETGANVILTYRDTFHTHSSWPKVAVMPAWICNVDEEHPKGEWAIEGRLGNYIVDIDDGIAGMPLPEPYEEGGEEK